MKYYHRSILGKLVTGLEVVGTVQNDDAGRWPPWTRMPSMREMATELGIDYDELIESFSEDRTPQEMATKFDISNEMAANLKEHYYKFGISSVMGGD